MPDTAVRGLLEALPYVKAWANQVVVVKLGGAAMAAADLTDAVTEDLVLLHAVGVRVVLVHGGGSAVSEVGKRLGLQPRFVDGLRVTDDDTMKVAQMVQVGGISRDLVSGIARRGGQALALSGSDGGGLLRAAPRKHTSLDSGEEVDLGRVLRRDCGRTVPCRPSKARASHHMLGRDQARPYLELSPAVFGFQGPGRYLGRYL